ncbi:phage tail terminator protein [Rhodovulum steppense]|uniref:Gp37 protein n=1 Tax=Rhodovulum steppense TaxID=540251 RepID=A0A4R1YVK8_9RHOB|nr:hypothetical protein [Rhodovulum steppense]TCM84783.1 hypothetical protein EV216_110101 [Rhodovulum steppense]
MIGAVVQRLVSAAPELAGVEVAEDVEALAKGTAAAHGTCFVIPYRERARPNQIATGGYRQLVQTQILTAFVVRHHNDARGAERAAMFDGLKRAVEVALAGWLADECENPFELVGGESSPLATGVSIYVQTWETTRFLTGE